MKQEKEQTQYVIGVDVGSQSAKVIIFDLQGRPVSRGRRPLRPLDLSGDGRAEHPEDDLWTALAASARQAMDQFPGEPAQICGLGLCSIRFCRASLDEQGQLAAPVLSWMDRRVSRPWEGDITRVRYLTASSGYLTYRLTGEMRDSAAAYQGMWPIDTDRWRWSPYPEAYRRTGMRQEQLFELVKPGQLLGTITPEAARETGFPPGLPVAATANDKAVEALGAGLTDAGGELLISLGTYIASMVPGRENRNDSDRFWTNFACQPGAYLYESRGIRRGMATVAWFRDLLGEEPVRRAEEQGIPVEEYLNRQAAAVPAGSEGLLTVLDWLAPGDHPYRRGTLVGFDGRHTGAHIYRSILEGIAMTMKNRAEVMNEALGFEPKGLAVTGGGAEGDLFMQIFADVFGLPAVRNAVPGAAALGAAVCAAAAVRGYRSIPAAAGAMVRRERTFTPRPEQHRFYRRLNRELYRSLPDFTDPLYRQHARIFSGS